MLKDKKSPFCDYQKKGDREVNDYYTTDPKSVHLLLRCLQKDNIKLNKNIWECACGCGNISEFLKEYGYNVKSTDLIDRGYGAGNIDFLQCEDVSLNTDIITNPPFKHGLEFVKNALDVVATEHYVIMLLRIQFLEGKQRKQFFDKQNPKYIYVFSERQTCYKNNDTTINNSAMCFAWFIWQKGYVGETTLRWI